MVNSNNELQDYYQKETVYQREKYASTTVNLLHTAASRINSAAKEIRELTGKPYEYRGISYPQPKGDVKQEFELISTEEAERRERLAMPVSNAKALTISDTPITERLQLVHKALLTGENFGYERYGKGGGELFTSIKDNPTARGELKQLIEETARVMDDVMVTLITAKDVKVKAERSQEDSDKLEIGNHDALSDSGLLMNRIALAGTPPNVVFEKLRDNTGRSTEWVEDHAARLYDSEPINEVQSGVVHKFGGTQVEHMEAGLAAERVNQKA